MMNGEQLQKIVETFRPVAGEIPDLSIQAVSAAPDAAGYAQKFMIALHLAGLTINGIKPENNSEMLYPTPDTVSSPQMKGLILALRRALFLRKRPSNSKSFYLMQGLSPRLRRGKALLLTTLFLWFHTNEDATAVWAMCSRQACWSVV